MSLTQKRQAGFTLIEIAIVLLIVIILLGYTVAMFPLQQELKQYRKADAEMESIIDHLIGFAQVYGRLPCPDDNDDGNTDGEEDFDVATGTCDGYYGFLPAKTLGMNGRYRADGSLIDPWGTPYGYAISDFDAGAAVGVDLVTAHGVRDEGMANVDPDLYICDDSNLAPNDPDVDCTQVTGLEVVPRVAVVLISLGKDFDVVAPSNIQAENVDDLFDGTNDKVYIFAARRDDYDDIVKWIPRSLLFSKMIEADQLP